MKMLDASKHFTAKWSAAAFTKFPLFYAVFEAGLSPMFDNAVWRVAQEAAIVIISVGKADPH